MKPWQSFDKMKMIKTRLGSQLAASNLEQFNENSSRWTITRICCFEEILHVLK